jgi:hypothetical protein
MIVEDETACIPRTSDPQLLADLFHALTQPLTTLRCCLSLCLRKQAKEQQNRRDLELALQAAESVSGLIAGIRDLVEDASPSSAKAASSLDECLRDVVEDLRPVADSMELTMSVASEPSLRVGIESYSLRKGIFHLLEFALSSSTTGQELEILTAKHCDEAALVVRTDAAKQGDVDDKLQARLALGIARHMFENAGGDLQLQLKPALWLRVHLPLAANQALRVRIPASRCCA